MTIELYVLSEDPELEREGYGRVRIGVSADDDPDPEQDRLTTTDGRPLQLVFRALFKEDDVATDWERRLTEQLRRSGIKVGNEFFFVNDAMVESLCDAAVHAEQHEWVVPPVGREYVDLAMDLSRARQRVDDTFEVWAGSVRSANAEIRINSYTQYVARDEKRIRDLEASYIKPRFFNDGAVKNSQLDYAISRLKEQTSKWRREIVRLRREVEESELAFAEWQAAIARVHELESALEALSETDRRQRGN